MGGDPKPFQSGYFYGTTLLLIVILIILFYDLLTGIYNPILFYFCVPVIILMILGFAVYACIIYPLQDKEYLHNHGYKKCAMYGLRVMIFGEAMYAKIVVPLALITLISEFIF